MVLNLSDIWIWRRFLCMIKKLKAKDYNNGKQSFKVVIIKQIIKKMLKQNVIK